MQFTKYILYIYENVNTIKSAKKMKDSFLESKDYFPQL